MQRHHFDLLYYPWKITRKPQFFYFRTACCHTQKQEVQRRKWWKLLLTCSNYILLHFSNLFLSFWAWIGVEFSSKSSTQIEKHNSSHGTNVHPSISPLACLPNTQKNASILGTKSSGITWEKPPFCFWNLPAAAAEDEQQFASLSQQCVCVQGPV